MSKYQGLPDIDTAADVFETADEPDLPLRPSDGADSDTAPKAVSEHIDQSGLPERRRVEKAFRRTRRPDGSYQLGLPPLNRASSSSSSGDEFESRDGSSRPRETPAARLRRLRAELEQVEREITAGPADKGGDAIVGAAGEGSSGIKGKRKSVLPPRPPVDLVGELNNLRGRIASLDSDGASLMSGEMGARARVDDGLLDRLRGVSVNGQGATQEGAGPTTLGSRQMAEEPPALGEKASVSDIDQRLATLESIIGASGEGIDQNPTSPLIHTLNKLDHLLSLLTQPRNLDALSRRLKLLLVDLDRAAAASRRTGLGAGVGGSSSVPTGTSASDPPSSVTLPSSEYTQLQTLFALLPRLDPLLPILPPLLARLRSLAALHAEAGRVVEGLKRLEEGDKASRDEVVQLREAVNGVREGLVEGGKRVVGNWEAVQARMEDLEERVKRLNEG